MTIQGHLAVVVGHMKNSGGAKGVPPINVSEYEYNTDLANMIKQAGEARGQVVDIFFRDKDGVVGAYKRVKESLVDACIELHFNASDGKVMGSETWYVELSKDKELLEEKFALVTQKQICDLFGRPAVGGTNRGIKMSKKDDRRYNSLSQVKDFPCILIEPFFGTNAEDAQLAVDKKQDLANAIILAFEEWLELVKS